MKLLIGIIAALFIGVLLAQWIRADPGYVMFSIGQWTVETSVVVFAVVLLAFFLLVYLGVRFIIQLLRAPRQVRAASKRHSRHDSQRLLTKGTKELIQGQWKKAEISLSAGLEKGPTVLHCIGAAQAAQRLGEKVRRDNYLSRTSDMPEADALSAKLVQAELWLEDNQPEQAKALLEPLVEKHSDLPRAQELLAHAYRALGEWDPLKDLLADMRKHKLLDETRHGELQLQTYRELMHRATSTAELQALWRHIPDTLHHDEALLIDYAGQLRDHDAPSEAEALLREALNRQWSEKLIVGYGEIGRGNAAGQLATAEGWLEQHGNNPYLLLTLGKLARRSRQLDKARTYLEQSIRALPNPDAYQTLGEMLEEAGDTVNASRCYRTGLQLLSGKPEEKEGIAVESDQQILLATENAPDTNAPLSEKVQPAS